MIGPRRRRPGRPILRGPVAGRVGPVKKRPITLPWQVLDSWIGDRPFGQRDSDFPQTGDPSDAFFVNKVARFRNFFLRPAFAQPNRRFFAPGALWRKAGPGRMGTVPARPPTAVLSVLIHGKNSLDVPPHSFHCDPTPSSGANAIPRLAARRSCRPRGPFVRQPVPHGADCRVRPGIWTPRRRGLRPSTRWAVSRSPGGRRRHVQLRPDQEHDGPGRGVAAGPRPGNLGPIAGAAGRRAGAEPPGLSLPPAEVCRSEGPLDPPGRPELAAATAQEVLARIVFLPLYPEMPDRELERMAAVVCRQAANTKVPSSREGVRIDGVTDELAATPVRHREPKSPGKRQRDAALHRAGTPGD